MSQPNHPNHDFNDNHAGAAEDATITRGRGSPGSAVSEYAEYATAASCHANPSANHANPSALKPENAAIFDSSDDECQQGPGTALHWFRRGLRFHDNPALCESIKLSHDFRCIYIIDPSTINTSSRVETNKWR